MNRRFLLILSMFLSFVFSFGQTSKHITLQFNADDFYTENGDSGTVSILSSKYTLSYLGDSLTPALPFVGINIAIGRGDVYDGFTTTRNDILFRNEVLIAPTPQPLLTGVVGLSPQRSLFLDYPSGIYPQNNVIYTGTHEVEGYKMLSFLVCPFSYSTSLQRLYLADNITLTISLNQMSSNPEGYTYGNSSPSEAIQQAVVNPEDFITQSQANPSEILNTDGAEYLIITHDSLKEAFMPLVRWKNQKGIRTKVLTKSEIDLFYASYPSEVRIKKALIDYKNYHTPSLKYVLIGGHPYIIPMLRCHMHVNNQDKDVPTDHYYACLGTLNWDTNGNGIYGEVGDSVDIAPDIAVTRIPANNVANVEAFVNRTIEYETNPNLNIWDNNFLMAGNKLYNNIFSSQPLQSDAEAQGNRMYDLYVRDNWDGSVFKFYDTYTDHTDGADYLLSPEHLHQELSKGYNFVHVNTHGVMDCWELEGPKIDQHSYYYHSEEAALLDNPRHTLIATTACQTNRVSAGVYCLSRGFVDNPRSGVIGYLGSTVAGWTTTNASLGPSITYNGLFFQNLFSSKEHCMAEALRMAKLQEVSQCSTEDEYRWVMYSLTLLGDAEMPIYVSTPKRFEDVQVSRNGTSLTINVVDTCKICVMSYDDDGESYYYVKETSGITSFSNITGTASICLTKPGYIPKLFLVGDTIFLQNETFSKHTEIIADRVYAGSNVTSEKSNGPVIVSGNSVEISSPSGTTIKNDFEIKKGAEFRISTF